MRQLSGRTIALFFGALLAVAALVVVAYKLQPGHAELRLSASSAAAAAAANATVHPLDGKDVRAATSGLDDYLNTAVGAGNATVAQSVRAEEFVRFLRDRTREPGPVVYVLWDGAVVRLEWSGA